MTYPRWFEKDGIKKLFSELPSEIGWEPASGHYDFQIGQWVPRDPLDHDGDGEKGGSITAPGDLKALRAAYQAKFGKKPFNGWDEAKLKEKLG